MALTERQPEASRPRSLQSSSRMSHQAGSFWTSVPLLAYAHVGDPALTRETAAR